MRDTLDVAIVGAGPYGLSLAAHLTKRKISYVIFGEPMEFWSRHMPTGMRLKSEGFASDLYDPDHKFPLSRFCGENCIPYADIGLPVRVEDFVEYGKEFQRRYVPNLEAVKVTALMRGDGAFDLMTSDRGSMRTRNVIIATGICDFAHVPPELTRLPPDRISHSSDHGDVRRFRDRRVAVLGAGASAIDVAVALKNAGADAQLITRGGELHFHSPPQEPRPILERMGKPRSGLGTGWRSRLCTDAPWLFFALPQPLRFRITAKHLGPAPCWFTREEVTGRIPVHLDSILADARIENDCVRLTLQVRDEAPRRVDVDHIVAGTGFKVAMSRLRFLERPVLADLRCIEDTPVLDRDFQSSLRGLFVIGASAANSFGPLLRFAFGADYAAKRVTRYLANSL